jgi:hypothetical protein
MLNVDVGKSYTPCKIIYGYKPGCLDDILDSLVILIEPRTDLIDEIQSLKKDIILIKKVLVKTNTLTETILYYNKERKSYFMKGDDLIVNGVNLFNIKKYQVYTTSIENIIKQYNIQNIHSIVINMNIGNCNEIIQSVESYNHILSRIYIDKQIADYQCKILDNFYCERETTKKPDYIGFIHKNLHVELPKIVVYFCENPNKRLKEMVLFLQQYKMGLVINKLSDDTKNIDIDTKNVDVDTKNIDIDTKNVDVDTKNVDVDTKNIDIDTKFDKGACTIVPYPKSIECLVEPITILKSSKIYYENVINNLECIFDTDNSSELDIIIQFNPKYFDSKNTLQIMYPLQDNTLYANRVFDVIYGTKNCMFMLYQILKSKYFTDYIKEKMLEKKTLFKIFSKRYFYDYISKIFVIKEIQ